MNTCTWKAKGTLHSVTTEVDKRHRPSLHGVISLPDGDIHFYANDPSLIQKLQRYGTGPTITAIGEIRPHKQSNSKPYFLTLLDAEIDT
jgi:hypothetical protein